MLTIVLGIMPNHIVALINQNASAEIKDAKKCQYVIKTAISQNVKSSGSDENIEHKL